MARPLIVGAYASLPTEVPDQVRFYEGLAARGVSGIEVPLAFTIHDNPRWLADMLLPFTDSILTGIPGTMQRLTQDPTFGLASPDEQGRLRAVSFIKNACESISMLQDVSGAQLFTGMHVHSAPSGTAEKDPFIESLSLVSEVCLAYGVTPYIEHCDAASHRVPGEKRFLDLADEIAVAQETGVKITVNWGRSVVESHDANMPAEQIAELAANNLLGGIMFSGAGAEATQYGPQWADAHLPLSVNEPASWMTPERVIECEEASQGTAAYHGVKIQTPADRPYNERLSYLDSILELLAAYEN